MSQPSPSEIYVRAYTEKPGAKPVGSKPGAKGKDEASEWSLVFDCETSTDPAQRVRFGVYQVRHFKTLKQEGFFFDTEAISTDELKTLKHYAKTKGLEAITVEAFRSEILLQYGYQLSGRVIGFNLPFDLSRIALDQSEARGSMRGGFTFKLSPDTRDPNVRVKHISARAALIDFAAPAKQRTPRGMRNRGIPVKPHRGYFVDIKTLAAALTSKSFSLGRLSKHLGTKTQKHETDEHGGPLTEAYLDYARADTQVTWECYEKLILQYADHGLDTPCHRVLSEASIGKGYLKQMGIKPLLGYQPDFPRSMFGSIMAAYYGGRAEVRIRRLSTQVLYCDFKSMYPTVSALMGLWPFVIADQITWRDSTKATQALLNRITIADLQSPETWKLLKTLVKLKPKADILPVRAKYDGKTNTIGLNYLSCDQPLWYTLADCIASKLLSGKTPIIDEAMTFEAGPPQPGLKPHDLFGNQDYRIDPNTDDLFTRLIDLRDEAKAKGDNNEQAIKIIANSTSYGIFMEVNRDDAPKPEPLDVFGSDGQHSSMESTAIEEPGKYFHPLLGTLITAAARLMLAVAEKLTADKGLDWVFCDTDSIAMAKPAEMINAEFIERGQKVVDWFAPLNPYRKAGSILKIEDANYVIDSKELEPLHCYAISAKRYALYNLDAQGYPILRKASAHGLGHLMSPYGDDDTLTPIPPPNVPLSAMGVKRWQHDLWIKIIQAALAGKPNRVALDWHPSLQKPAISRYGATSPKLLKWMDHWNEGKGYRDQVKPFGFLVSLMARTVAFAPTMEVDFVDPTQRGRPTKATKPKPIAPFGLDYDLAAAQAFDRESGGPIDPTLLKTNAEALAQYHLSPEDKFENGDFCNTGRTERRHVIATSVRLIGKEANKVGDSGEQEPATIPQAEYNVGAPAKIPPK